MNTNQSLKTGSQYTRKKIQEFSYGLNDVIGKGYSSQVYKGRHDQSDQPVAVKVIDMKMLKNQINRTLLESQIQILKELKSVDNVLTLHEVYTTKNNTYIITELCGSDLNKKIKNKITEQQAFHFMDQIIQGYLQVYQKQIVHRDLKPANILLTDNEEAKIADFGFAIKAEQLLKPSKYNVGSPLYMAPQSLRKNQYSYKTDIWSMGVIFYQMLTGETPWKAKTQKQLLKKIQTQRIQIVLERKKIYFTPLTKEFLAKCLSIQKHKRIEPFQLKKYTFKQTLTNVLMESKSNNHANKLNPTFTSPKNQLFSKFNFPSAKTPSSKNTENLSFNATMKLNTTTETTTTKVDMKKDNLKIISKQLISEIHFCRYLFKLLGRIKQSSQKGMFNECKSDIKEVQKQYTNFIKHKIDKLIGFQHKNFLNVDQKIYQEYKLSSDYKKILKISKQYKERYQAQLSANWGQYFDGKFTTVQTLELMKNMINIFLASQSDIESNIDKHSKDIVILDYLITSKQLLQMLSQGENYEKFSRKSKIQEIVEGTTTTITVDLFQKILDRAQQLSGRAVEELDTNLRGQNTRQFAIAV